MKGPCNSSQLGPKSLQVWYAQENQKTNGTCHIPTVGIVGPYSGQINTYTVQSRGAFLQTLSQDRASAWKKQFAELNCVFCKFLSERLRESVCDCAGSVVD